MIFPKFALIAGSKRCCCGFHGILVIAKRKILKINPHLTGVCIEHLLEYGHKLCAVRSFKITKNGDHHGGIW